MTATALLFATTPSADGGPAAALRVRDTTLLGRLLDQLESLGIARGFVVTRPEWADSIEAVAEAAGASVTVVCSADVGEDLLKAAEVAREVRGRLLIGLADVLVHRRPLAVLLRDPRIQTGMLSTASRSRAGWANAMRSARGRIIGASSAYHRVTRPDGYLLGCAVVAAADLDRLAAVATELAHHAGDPRPASWEEEFERKVARWRPEAAAVADAAAPPMEAATEELLELRIRAAREDAVSLLAVGLVRAGVQVGNSQLRAFFYARPLSADAVAHALEELDAHDEDRLALDSAVKAVDGFFTTFFVSPYSRYIARFAARRGWTPNAMTTASMLIGLLAASSFALGTRAGLVAGAVLLQAAFTVDCVDGQLARYTLTFSKLGAWLDSMFDRGKEYVVYAGLAIGASRGFGDDVWTLAAAALGLQTFRHAIDFSFAARQQAVLAADVHSPLAEPEELPARAWVPSPRGDGVTGDGAATTGAVAVATAVRPASRQTASADVGSVGDRRDPRVLRRLARSAIRAGEALNRWKPLRWARRIFLLPIGERFALISLTAALGSPRLTFVVLLSWGGVVAVYAFVGRSLRSVVA